MVMKRNRGMLLRLFFSAPRDIGTVAASGRVLARAVAAAVDPAVPGHVVELGAGTGALTRGLVAHGIPPERLVLVERQPTLLRLLREHYPTATVLDSDALNFPATVAAAGLKRVAAVVSAVPLLNLPSAVRVGLLRDCFNAMDAQGRFVQITYGTGCPVSRQGLREIGIETRRVRTVWLNIPPTHVWVFRHAGLSDHRH
jgi:phosphatidylethanolamine/phosphatidyl-N-methylethanolamine N-methyltransferase